MAKRKKATKPEAGDEGGQQRRYRGASGQQAVVSEFLYRLLNVAEPYVDSGEDAFIVKEPDDSITRVQAKHATAEQQKGGYVAQFNLPWGQFNHRDEPPLVYVLAVRFGDRWSDFLVIRRSVLQRLQREQHIGSENRNPAGEITGLKLRLVFTEDDVKAQGGFSLQRFRGAFSPWPPPLA